MKVVSPEYARTSHRLHQLLEKQIGERRYIIITDENISGCCLPHLSEFILEFPPLDIIELEPGEACKQFEVAVELWKHLLELNITRFDVLVCVGGGSVSDLGGFIASTYKRGIPFIFVPTTLLAMTDAAIGGKNGIDFEGLKNAIGTLNQPEAIFIYRAFVETLPSSQIASGMAEVIKHGVIQGGELWSKLISDPAEDSGVSDSLLQLSVQTKLSIVKEDPFERDTRKVLNFGHSVGHALESWFLIHNAPIEHGIAVAKGMIIESQLAYEMGLLSEADLSEIHSVIHKYMGRDFLSIPLWAEVKPYLKGDKKFDHNKMLFALPTRIGNVNPVVAVEESRLEAVYSKLAIR